MKKSINQIKEAYLAMQDITEVEFAKEHFGSYETWLAFVEKNQQHVDMWRKELELTLKHEAYDQVLDTMRSSDSKPDTKLSAAKFLLQKGILNRDGKEMVTEGEVRERAKKKASRVDNDYLRLVISNAKTAGE